MSRRRMYGKKTEVDGIVFDSELESKYYLHLKELGLGEVIMDLETHKSFRLQEQFTDMDGNVHKEITYAPDFVYFDKRDDTYYYVDTKGYLDDMSRLIWKLFVKHMMDNNTEGKPMRFQIMKHSVRTGWVDYDEYKKLMASARRKATIEKNNAIKAKEQMKKDLKTIKTLREKPTALTKLQAEKLEMLTEKYKDYII